MNDEAIFIGGYIIRRTFDNISENFGLTIENTLTGEEIEVKESELTDLLDGFWGKLRR